MLQNVTELPSVLCEPLLALPQNTWTHTWFLKYSLFTLVYQWLERWIIHTNIFTTILLCLRLATWALTLRKFKVCYRLLIVTWSSIHGGGHLDLGKIMEWTFLMFFIPVLCCIIGSGRYQVWWEWKGNWLMLMCTSFNYWAEGMGDWRSSPKVHCGSRMTRNQRQLGHLHHPTTPPSLRVCTLILVFEPLLP